VEVIGIGYLRQAFSVFVNNDKNKDEKIKFGTLYIEKVKILQSFFFSIVPIKSWTV